MANKLRDILDGIRALDLQLERELSVARAEWGYRFVARRVRFDPEVRSRHRGQRTTFVRFLRDSSVLNLLTAPITYSLILPFALLDLWVTAFQWICFPAFGVETVARSRFIAIDRHRLGYLNGIEKLHCVYCGYVNGLIAYVREVAARTEQYWCPIKHARRIHGAHPRYHLFTDYGDADGYHRELPELRALLRSPPPAGPGPHVPPPPADSTPGAAR